MRYIVYCTQADGARKPVMGKIKSRFYSFAIRIASSTIRFKHYMVRFR